MSDENGLHDKNGKVSTIKIYLKTGATDDRPMFISGSFNDWSADDPDFQMSRTGAADFEYDFKMKNNVTEPIEYKYTRGSWDECELDSGGNDAKNRILPKGETVVHDHAPDWKMNGLPYTPALRPLIKTIDEHFEIPQLIKTRRITALLPHDYETSGKRYPVLYLQDGQNLFDDFAPFGSWELIKRLAWMADKGLPEFIVIAIDHAEKERIREFTPSTKTKLGVGEGEKYAGFLAETLKPHIDKTFRTLPGREHTGIGGSSMGGLISIYAAMQNPLLFSRLMVFSPSLWVTPDLPRRFIYQTPDFNGKVFLYGGGLEGSNMTFYLEHFREIIQKDPHNRGIELKLEINPKGRHSESDWGKVFPQAAKWLFNDIKSKKTKP